MDEKIEELLEEINYYPDLDPESQYNNQQPIVKDDEGEWYLEPLTVNKVYTVEPNEGFVAMKKVKFDVRVPTEINTLEDDVNMVDDGFKVDVEVQPSPESEIIELKEYITIATEKVIKEVGSQGANLIQIFTNVSNGLNELNRNINSSVEDLNASFNNIENIVVTKYENVIANTNSIVQAVNEQGESVVAKVTEFNNDTIAQLNDIQDEVKSNSSGLNKLKMLISSERDQTDGLRVFKNPSKYMKGVVNKNDMQTEDPSNPAPSNNLLIKSIKRFRGDRGPPDVSEPVKGVYYYNKFISIDDINELYNEENYAMFDINSLSEIRLLDNVNVNITRNNDQFTWNILNDYINTNLNISQDYPEGFNPIGVTNLTFNVVIDDPRLKNMNEWEQLSQYAFANNNTAIIKYNPNNQVDPQEITNRVVVLDEYQGNGETIYDPNEKIFINNHKYTFEEENEEYDEDIEGFKTVMQTTIVPVMDRIVLPEITTNKTIRYSIEDFNNIYSLTPGSQNTYRNDFVGFNTIDIPVNVNNKVVSLIATQNGLYRPSDIDVNAIGFSSVQVSIASSGNIEGEFKNLNGYVFQNNTSESGYSIEQYNIDHVNDVGFEGPYSGFNNIIVSCPEIDNANINEQNIITSRTGTYNIPSGKTGFNGFTVDVPSDVDNVNVNENNIITSRTGTYTIPSGKTGFNNFTVDVPSDVNNYNNYDINNRLNINSSGNGIIQVPSGYTGLGDIYYNVNVNNLIQLKPNQTIESNGTYQIYDYEKNDDLDIMEVNENRKLIMTRDEIQDDPNYRNIGSFVVDVVNNNENFIKLIRNNSSQAPYVKFDNTVSYINVDILDCGNKTTIINILDGFVLKTNIKNIKSIINTTNATSMFQMFYGCTSLTSVPLFDTSNVTDIQQMFKNCTSLTSVPLFDTSNVTDMISVFDGCSSLTSVPLYNTLNVPSMSGLFRGCTSLTSVPLFNTLNVTNMNEMFKNCTSLTSVPLFNTLNVTNMNSMFSRCTNLSNESLNNILMMCINSVVSSSNKKLNSYVSVSTSYNSVIPSLSNYNDFINAGWSLS